MYPGRGQMSGTSSDDGEAWSHARHLIYYVGMRYRSVVISIDVVTIGCNTIYYIYIHVRYLGNV